MGMINTFTKDPDATLDFDIDLAALDNGTGSSNWLNTDEKIDLVSWDVPAGLTTVTSDIRQDDTVARIYLSGGTLGTSYDVTAHITTDAVPPRIQDFVLRIRVQNLVAESTYSGDPSYSDKDAVRFLLEDTDTANFQFTDAELSYLLTQFPDPLFAASRAAKTLSLRYSKSADKQVGDLRISYSARAKAFMDLANDLEVRASISDLQIFAGGVYLADKQTNEQDTSLARPAFRRGMTDAPGNVFSPGSDWPIASNFP